MKKKFWGGGGWGGGGGVNRLKREAFWTVWRFKKGLGKRRACVFEVGEGG